MVNKAGVGARQTPLLNVWLILALIEMTGRQSQKAFDRLYRTLSLFPQCRLTQDLFLSLLAGHQGHVSAVDFKLGARTTRGTLVFGLGSGRSGSTTLTKMLSVQEATFASHEHPPILPWRNAEQRVHWHLMRMRILAERYQCVADVSHWWLPYVETILSLEPKARFVVIQRDREETVRSFLSIKGGERKGAINHWIAHDGSHYRKNIWDECYPKYDVSTLTDALYRYYDEYYERCSLLADKYPENVRVFPTSSLSTPDGQTPLLELCGIAGALNVEPLHLNKNSISDGARLTTNPFK